MPSVYPTTQPVNVIVTPSPSSPVNVSNIYAGPVNQTVVSYNHTQSVASTTWVILHNLGYRPNVTVVDSSGVVCEGDLVYTTVNTITLTFSQAISGAAYLS